MRLLRPISAAAVLSVFSACSDGPSTPEGAVTGVFGGPLLEMTSTGRVVRLQFVCSFVLIKSSIVPDAEGRFELPETPVPGTVSPATSAALFGRVTGDRIDATVRWTRQSGTTLTDYTLTRGQRGDYTGFACLAA